MKENWLGVALTLSLAVLPLGLVFLFVALLRQLFTIGLYAAMALEVPIAALSALCYLAFEGVVAAMYKRIM